MIQLRIFGHFTASCLASKSNNRMNYPYIMQVVRSRLQEQGHHSEKRYSGVVDCIKKVFQHEGLPGFYRGCATNLLRTTPAAVITFTSFEMIHRFLVSSFPPDPQPHTLWGWIIYKLKIYSIQQYFFPDMKWLLETAMHSMVMIPVSRRWCITTFSGRF